MHVKQSSGNPPKRAFRKGEKSNVIGRVEVDFDRQLEHGVIGETVANLLEVGVALPMHSGQPCPIVCADADEVATAAMIRPQDQPVFLEKCERVMDVGRFQIGAVLTDDDDFLISKLRHRFDGILKFIPEGSSLLKVNLGAKRYLPWRRFRGE